MKVNITKNVVSREDALRLCPDYVAFAEGDFSKFAGIWDAFDSVRKGASGITAVETGPKQFVFVRVTVTSVDHRDFRAVDGPVVRVSNGEYTWRVDGSKYMHALLPARVVKEIIRSVPT